MKRVSTLALMFLLSSIIAFSAPKYWVGPLNGNWSDRANWSDLSNGVGGAELPGTLDSVVFASNVKALVHVDLSPTVQSLSIYGNVTLFVSTPVTFPYFH